jgi:hypothetical protein
MKNFLSAVMSVLLVTGFSHVAFGQQFKASVYLGLSNDGSWTAFPSAADARSFRADVNVRADFPKIISSKDMVFVPVSHCVSYETVFDGEGDVQVCNRSVEWYQLALAAEQDDQQVQKLTQLIVVGNVRGTVKTAFAQKSLPSSQIKAWIESEAKSDRSFPKSIILAAAPERSLVSSWFSGLKIADLSKSIDQAAYLDFEANISLQAVYNYDEVSANYRLASLTTSGSSFSSGVLYYEHNPACLHNACIAILAPITHGHPLDLK